MKQLFTLVMLLSIFLSSCHTEDKHAPVLPDKEIQYRFSFSLEESYIFTEEERKMEEVALFLYDDKDQLVSSSYSQTPEISVSLSGKERITKAFAIVNFSSHPDWGVFLTDAEKLEPIDLKDDILSKKNQLDKWQKCTQLFFGTDKPQPKALSSPIPMSGSAELESGEVHHIILTPYVAKVTVKNTSAHFPDIKEVLIDNVQSFLPFIPSDQNPVYTEKCSIRDAEPEPNEENEIHYYIPRGTNSTLSATLGNESETSETILYPIETKEQKEPLVILLSEKQLIADVTKIEFGTEGGERSFQISSNLAWSASLQNQWFTLDATFGEGNRTLTITAAPNNEQEDINDTLTIAPVGDENPILSIPVSQKKKEVIIEEPDFSVSPATNLFEFDAKSHTRQITIICRDEKVTPRITSSGGTWLKTSLEEDPSNPLIKYVDILIFENNTGDLRFGKILIKSENKNYQYNVVQSHTKEIDPFTVELKYKGVVMGNELVVPAKASSGSIEVKNSTGKLEDDGYLALRAAEGVSWAKIKHEYNDYYKPDEIWHGQDGSILEFEENVGEERQMVAEFYSRQSGIVYHRMIFKQAAASNYIDMSSASLAVDRYGNIYDEPLYLKVESNKEWEIRNTAPWVKIKYIPNNRSQTVEITVDENTSQQNRSTEIEFVANGTVIKQFPITQSTVENSTFNLKYELNLEMTTVNDGFKDYLAIDESIIYYADNVEIYNPGTSSNVDETIKMRSDATYGFVTDAPASYNRIVVNNITSPLLIYPNYRGSASTQSYNKAVTISNKKYAQSLFRQIGFTLPIPAGVKRYEKVIYTIKIENITGNAKHDPPQISHTIISQK